jgi:hypothetical protein
MAIASNYGFDYEATLAPDEDGLYSGVARSLQAEAGSLPGLAGRSPRITVAGEAIRVDSHPSEAPPAAGWRWLELVPGLAGLALDRRLRSAAVRSFTVALPGLTARLRPGTRLRLTQTFRGGLGQAPVTEVRVLLVTPEGERLERAVSGIDADPW